MTELEQLLARLAEKGGGKAVIKQVLAGTATDITATTCTVEREGSAPLYDVRLNAIDDDLQSYFTIYPVDGSNVLVAIIENVKTEAVVIKCSEVECVKAKIGENTLVMDKDGIIFNGGANKGFVKINEMVSWMQKVYQDLQTLKTQLSTHPVAGNSAPLALIFNPTTPSPQVANFENEKIKQ